MPLYEYQCEGCGDVFEVMQKFADEPLTMHEKCGGKVNRLISAPAFHLKGSGWYATDYAKGANNSSGNGSKKNESGDEGTKDTANTSKTATKSEPAATKSSSDSSTSSSGSTSDKK